MRFALGDTRRNSLPEVVWARYQNRPSGNQFAVTVPPITSPVRLGPSRFTARSYSAAVIRPDCACRLDSGTATRTARTRNERRRMLMVLIGAAVKVWPTNCDTLARGIA